MTKRAVPDHSKTILLFIISISNFVRLIAPNELPPLGPSIDYVVVVPFLLSLKKNLEYFDSRTVIVVLFAVTSVMTFDEESERRD